MKLTLTDNTNSSSFTYIYIWWTLPSSYFQTVLWGPYFPLRAACLFSYGNSTFCDFVKLLYHNFI